MKRFVICISCFEGWGSIEWLKIDGIHENKNSPLDAFPCYEIKRMIVLSRSVLDVKSLSMHGKHECEKMWNSNGETMFNLDQYEQCWMIAHPCNWAC